jgi:hypothetical protein
MAEVVGMAADAVKGRAATPIERVKAARAR